MEIDENEDSIAATLPNFPSMALNGACHAGDNPSLRCRILKEIP